MAASFLGTSCHHVFIIVPVHDGRLPPFGDLPALRFFVNDHGSQSIRFSHGVIMISDMNKSTNLNQQAFFIKWYINIENELTLNSNV